MTTTNNCISAQPLTLTHNLDNETDQYQNMLENMVALQSEQKHQCLNQHFFKNFLQILVDKITTLSNQKYKTHKKNTQKNLANIRKAIENHAPLDFVEQKIKTGINELTFEEQNIVIDFDPLDLAQIKTHDKSLRFLQPLCKFDQATHKFNLEFQTYRKLIRKYHDTLEIKIKQIIHSIEKLSDNKISIDLEEFNLDPNHYLIDFDNFPNDTNQKLYYDSGIVTRPCCWCECRPVTGKHCGTNISGSGCCKSMNCLAGCPNNIIKQTPKLTADHQTIFCFPNWCGIFPCFGAVTIPHEEADDITKDNMLRDQKLKIKIKLILKEIPGPDIKLDDIAQSDLVSLYSVSSLPAYQDVYPTLPSYESLEEDMEDPPITNENSSLV